MNETHKPLSHDTRPTNMKTETHTAVTGEENLPRISQRRHFRMVLQMQNKDGIKIGQVISGNIVPSMNDERKAVEKFAKGRQILNLWDNNIPDPPGCEKYVVFRGLFDRGKYKGRTSAYHHWRIA